MRLKLMASLVEKILGVTSDPDNPRADMFLNERILSIGMVLPVAGIAAIMCWKNQTIRIVSDDEFDYTTMFGKTHRYAFANITGLRKNQDSMTLFVGQNKVHIESNAVMTKQLIDKINEALKQCA